MAMPLRWVAFSGVPFHRTVDEVIKFVPFNVM
jgi:hypothetical protein